MWCETVLVYTNTCLEVDADIMCAETLTQALSWMFKSKSDRLRIDTKPQQSTKLL